MKSDQKQQTAKQEKCMETHFFIGQVFTFGQVSLSGAISFLVGCYAGHRFSLWRDRIKDFNTLSAPLRATLLGQLKEPNPFAKEISIVEVDGLYWRIGRWRRDGFAAACKAYNHAIKTSPQSVASGIFELVEPQQIRFHAEKVLSFLKPR